MSRSRKRRLGVATVALLLCAPSLAADSGVVAARFADRLYYSDDRPVRARAAPDRIALQGVDGALQVVGLDRAHTPAELAAACGGLVKQGRGRRCFPVLTRAGSWALSDDQLVVTARPGRLDKVLPRVLAATGGALVRRARVPDTALVRVGARCAHDAVVASRALHQGPQIPGLVSAEPLLYRQLEPSAVTDDPLLAAQWHLLRQGDAVPGTGQIFADQAWDTTLGDPRVVIAVLDTGTQLDHEDLRANLVGGFDAARNDADPSPECVAEQAGRQADPSCPAERPYREAHGTAVAGVAAARGDNGLGVAGVCPLCSLMPVRLIAPSMMSSSLIMAEAFTRATDEGAWVLNNSWGSVASRYFPLTRVERDAFRYAYAQGRGGLGAVVVFAAGNESTDVASNPFARQPEVLTVSASTNLDDWASYSNYGDQIALSAPSRGRATESDDFGLVTADLVGAVGYAEGAYDLEGFSGTSAASPVVAGVAGLVLSANPALTADQVRVILTSTADPIEADEVDWRREIGRDLLTEFAYDATGHSRGFGYGRVNAGRAVAASLAPPLQGAACPDAACPSCGDDGRCRLLCEGQDDCLRGTVCLEGLCEPPQHDATAVGEPCSSDCAMCLTTLDNAWQPIEVCTAACAQDSDCPAGFDCRRVDADGTRLCANGQAVAGEPGAFQKCREGLARATVQVLGEDDETYCTDLCLPDTEGACPWRFHCGYASCRCVYEGIGSCLIYNCVEKASAGQSNWPYMQCFPDPGFGLACAEADDCKAGDYCGPDGQCRLDDRQGCLACAPCAVDADCGVRGMCLDRGDGNGPRCHIACGAGEVCPGDAVCREAGFRYMRADVCVSPLRGPDDQLCDPSWTCRVPCRDDVPCPAGQTCAASGDCVSRPGGSGDQPGDDAPPGCGCGAPARGATWLAALILAVAARKRGRGPSPR